jgi:nucleoside-diphosphate-sugar epimerase
MRITILGSSGFIGTKLRSYLLYKNCEVLTPTVDEILKNGNDHGVIFYCIGLTSDFRDRPFATTEAHVEILRKILEQVKFKKLIYLSSTRLYQGSKTTKEEDPILIKPSEIDSIYNISKALGESLCLNTHNKVTCIARLSNVVGYGQNADTFLGQLLESAKNGKVHFGSGPDAAKDYISINVVTDILYKIALSNSYNSYNLASGINYKNSDIAQILRSNYDCEIIFPQNPKYENTQVIDVSRIKNEFNFRSGPIEDIFRDVIANARMVG